MQRRLGIMIGIVAMLVGSVVAMAQLPVEVMAGHKRATVDILFFRFFKNKAAQNGHWLFFNRNRASVDYTMTPSSNLPQFGCTEAISYNPPKWKGLAPVAVVQLLNRGVYPKLGLQYAKSGRAYSLFTWVVAETLKRPQVDWFFLGRYTPKLGNRLYLFTQVELINAFPTGTGNAYTFTQRLRLGLKTKQYQLGAGADFTAIGRNRLTATQNIGVFVRHEF